MKATEFPVQILTPDKPRTVRVSLSFSLSLLLSCSAYLRMHRMRMKEMVLLLLLESPACDAVPAIMGSWEKQSVGVFPDYLWLMAMATPGHP